MGGHAMCMVGYQDDADVPGGGYFLVRNSWGTAWARKARQAQAIAACPTRTWRNSAARPTRPHAATAQAAAGADTST